MSLSKPMNVTCDKCKLFICDTNTLSEMTSHRNNCNTKYITTIPDWIQSYDGNNNTAVESECSVGLSILLGYNLGTKEELPELYKNVKPYNLVKNILGLLNLTQSDNIGGTGDIGIIFKDGSVEYFSITHSGKKKKCIRNPSGKTTYGLQKTDEMEEVNEQSFYLAKKYREENIGEIPNKKWKRVTNCPGSKKMSEYLACEGAISWNNMSKETKIKNLKKILDLTDELKTNANGIIYWNKKENSIREIYKWKLKINLEDYLDCYNEGIYIYHGTPGNGNTILKTQTKYNNGIIELPAEYIPSPWSIKKSKNYLSSWNCNAYPNLDNIFELEIINLIK